MTTTTERSLTVGDRWKFVSSGGGVADGVVALVDGEPRIVDGSGRAYAYGPNDRDVGHMWTLLDVPAAAPLAADRCKAPEGYTQCILKCGNWKPAGFGRCATCNRKATGYANSKCTDWTPPLAAQPAETLPLDAPCPGQCGGGAADDNGPCAKCKPAPQPAPATPVCCTKDKEATACGGSILKRIICHDVPPILMCDAHWMLRESRMVEGAITPYTGPERLERPRLAHSSMWADEAEDVS